MLWLAIHGPTLLLPEPELVTLSRSVGASLSVPGANTPSACSHFIADSTHLTSGHGDRRERAMIQTAAHADHRVDKPHMVSAQRPMTPLTATVSVPQTSSSSASQVVRCLSCPLAPPPAPMPPIGGGIIGMPSPAAASRLIICDSSAASTVAC